MVKLSNTRIGLVATMAVLLSAVLLMPVGIGLNPGTDVGTAPTVAPGYYPNEIRTTLCYYNVSCTVGANLTVVITYVGGHESGLDICAPNGSVLSFSNSFSGEEVVTTICDSDQLFTIRVLGPNGPGGRMRLPC